VFWNYTPGFNFLRLPVSQAIHYACANSFVPDRLLALAFFENVVGVKTPSSMVLSQALWMRSGDVGLADMNQQSATLRASGRKDSPGFGPGAARGRAWMPRIHGCRGSECWTIPLCQNRIPAIWRRLAEHVAIEGSASRSRRRLPPSVGHLGRANVDDPVLPFRFGDTRRRDLVEDLVGKLPSYIFRMLSLVKQVDLFYD
jgi:hypothetical protein